MRIALDLDGVLADLQHQMIEETDYTRSDFEQWDKPDYNHFMSEASRVWREHWNDIPPVEDHLDLKTAQLSANHHVDIVTNTAGQDKYVKSWLNKHGVVFDDIVRPYSFGGDKPDLDYDVYIDDKPAMAGQVEMLYLRDRWWNQKVRGLGPGKAEYFYHSYEDCFVDSEGLPQNHFANEMPWVVRVTDLHDVLYDLDRQS